MKVFNRPQRKGRVSARERAQLLLEFDRSGLSAAAFAREHGLNYTTFCGWRQRRDQGKGSPVFVEVELPAPSVPVELWVELGTHARLRVQSENQVALNATQARRRPPERVFTPSNSL